MIPFYSCMQKFKIVFMCWLPVQGSSVGHAYCIPQKPAILMSMRYRSGVDCSVSHDALSVEGALVLLLCVCLITEIFTIARGRYSYIKNDNSYRESRPLRTTTGKIGKKSCSTCLEKRNIHSLDILWRRMQKATSQMQLINLRHHMITKVMMEARIQARKREREKLQQKKARMLARVLNPWDKAVSRL